MLIPKAKAQKRAKTVVVNKTQMKQYVIGNLFKDIGSKVVIKKSKTKKSLPNADFLNKKDTHLPRVIPIVNYAYTKPLDHGTFCGIINKHLITAQCPLPKGVCVWKHRSTGVCKYRKDATLTIQSLAILVGEHVPNDETIIKLKADLLLRIKEELST